MKRKLLSLRVVLSLWETDDAPAGVSECLELYSTRHEDSTQESGYLYSFELDATSLATLCADIAKLAPVFSFLAENPSYGGFQFMARGDTTDVSAWFKVEERFYRGTMSSPPEDDIVPAIARLEAIKALVTQAL